MNKRLVGRRAIVTGAARGLGRSIAHALVREGARVSACDKDASITRLATDSPHSSGPDVWGSLEVADVSDARQVERFVERAARSMGGIDIVVANAGVVRATRPTKDAYDMAVADFDEVVGVNLRGVFLTGRAAIPHMLNTGGDIVNITTDHIHTCGWPEHLDHSDHPDCPWHEVRRPALGGKNFDVYDASKWGIKGITSTWARALAPHRIRVNSFGMGATVTPMFLGMLGDRPLPPGTMQSDDVAAVLVDLLAEGPDGRTGDDVQVWAGHGTVLPPVGLEGRLAATDVSFRALPGGTDPRTSDAKMSAARDEETT